MTLLITIFLQILSPIFQETKLDSKTPLSESTATHFARLPLRCAEREFPYKPWYVITDSTMIGKPKDFHPAFYGCFDWHSSVHGHWLMAAIYRRYPSSSFSDSIADVMDRHLSAENMTKETQIFKGVNTLFERIYGWAWLLELQTELDQINTDKGRNWAKNTDTLSRTIRNLWIPFLRKLNYPVREPEHYNLAFALCLSWDYTLQRNDIEFQQEIKKAALRLYGKDKNCPINYEPGGFDFLSPCLEEARLMSRVMPKDSFQIWIKGFLPQLFIQPEKNLKVCKVSDPKDGKLVHLYGVNFSRAWSLFEISKILPTNHRQKLQNLAQKHFNYSYPHVSSSEYMGDHWLGSFALYTIFSQ